ncbi:hypothetical protein HPB52_023607 [Rhipicephalus sanguineus]|uniref:Uncharacterized protein n=1 Tax=Rhipicephalus sanguineus TaxID=34632 RepID=A0A9D4T3C8_RHISA|nr:hypothetical protein HPB52_023607 [Rhipicephalus sanguineus]
MIPIWAALMRPWSQPGPNLGAVIKKRRSGPRANLDRNSSTAILWFPAHFATPTDEGPPNSNEVEHRYAREMTRRAESETPSSSSDLLVQNTRERLARYNDITKHYQLGRRTKLKRRQAVVWRQPQAHALPIPIRGRTFQLLCPCPAWREGERPLERERLWRALRRLAAGVTERLLLDAAEVLEVALELRELAPLGPQERLRPR